MRELCYEKYTLVVCPTRRITITFDSLFAYLINIGFCRAIPTSTILKVDNYGSIFRASPSGVWGEPSRATAEKGEKIQQRMAELTVEALEKAFAYMEKKEKFNYSYF